MAIPNRAGSIRLGCKVARIVCRNDVALNYDFPKLLLLFIFKKIAQPWPLSVYFRSIKTNNTILQQIIVKNVQMSIQYTAPGFKPMTFQT